MSHIPKVEEWLAAARRKMDEWADLPNSICYQEAKKNVEEYEALLARLREVHRASNPSTPGSGKVSR